jgi:F0F1-type ATP synthase assembly protein I
MHPNPPKQNNQKSSGLHDYARYSGMAFQMIIIIAAFVWAGKKIDDYFFQSRRIFIIILSLLGVFISIYIVLKDLLKVKKK